MKLGAFSISLAVKDLETSRKFYEKFGFKVFGGQPALLFRDTMCGPTGSTVIFTTRGSLGYRLAIPYIAPYEFVKDWVVPILDSFAMFDAPSARQLPAQ